MTQQTTREEAREAIRQSLLAYRADGVKNPLIPVYTDSDGDGKPDIYGLDLFSRLVLHPNATVAETVSVSDGSGVEAMP